MRTGLAGVVAATAAAAAAAAAVDSTDNVGVSKSRNIRHIVVWVCKNSVCCV